MLYAGLFEKEVKKSLSQVGIKETDELYQTLIKDYTDTEKFQHTDSYEHEDEAYLKRLMSVIDYVNATVGLRKVIRAANNNQQAELKFPCKERAEAFMKESHVKEGPSQVMDAGWDTLVEEMTDFINKSRSFQNSRTMVGYVLEQTTNPERRAKLEAQLKTNLIKEAQKIVAANPNDHYIKDFYQHLQKEHQAGAGIDQYISRVGQLKEQAIHYQTRLAKRETQARPTLVKKEATPLVQEDQAHHAQEVVPPPQRSKVKARVELDEEEQIACTALFSTVEQSPREERALSFEDIKQLKESQKRDPVSSAALEVKIKNKMMQNIESIHGRLVNSKDHVLEANYLGLKDRHKRGRGSLSFEDYQRIFKPLNQKFNAFKTTHTETQERKEEMSSLIKTIKRIDSNTLESQDRKWIENKGKAPSFLKYLRAVNDSKGLKEVHKIIAKLENAKTFLGAKDPTGHAKATKIKAALAAVPIEDLGSIGNQSVASQSGHGALKTLHESIAKHRGSSMHKSKDGIIDEKTAASSFQDLIKVTKGVDPITPESVKEQTSEAQQGYRMTR